MVILVSGYIIRRPLGGLTWHYLNYVLGLLRLGHDVYYIEDSEDQPACFDPTKVPPRGDLSPDESRSPHEYVQKDPSYGLNFASTVFTRFEMPERWAYYDAHRSMWCGPAAEHIDKIISSADLLLNVSNSILLRPWLLKIPARALIDTDPVFGQLRHKHLPAWRERAMQHTSFLTFGENFGNPGCTIPSDGLPWKPTRQPLVLDHWKTAVRPSADRFTTVLSWDSYPPGKDNAKQYGLKSDSFKPYWELPARVNDMELELAIECPPGVWSRLESSGWKLRDGLAVSSDPWTYRDYIQSSGGEFSVAKEGYVTTRSGWFSERSAAYLASGRPVLTQETGFSEWMKTGEGVLPFNSPEEAVDGFARILGAYERHSIAAKELAETYFDHSKVLPQLLDSAMARTEIGDTANADISRVYSDVLQVVTAMIPPDECLILVDDQQMGLEGMAAGRKCFPFLERDGLHWGNPPNDGVAVTELERMRLEGASFLLLARPAFWWFYHYSGFIAHLDSNFETMQRTPNFVLYDLRKSL
ncbi:MAG TPA: hypothetical protein VMO47_02955 [Rhodothermales bacterium]|nr:hypothetical protein [Rhodothermales bacterium]